ncbi:MAG TPA: AAA family ATPase [Thermoanaerobaculia bacterium]|nr:AAA family ATPase [Thermoanaerobaculia bacterium]
MAELAGHEQLYAAGRLFRDQSLLGEGSLFREGVHLWTSPVLDEVYEQLVRNPDLSDETFWPKLKRQLEDKPAQVIQLAAEALFVVLLIEHPKSTTPGTKKDQLEEVLSWQPEPIDINPELLTALGQGVVNIGAGKRWRWFYWSYVVELARRWKAQATEVQRALASDPRKFREFLYSAPAPKADQQRAALLHLLFPRHFEDITNDGVKEEVISAFPQAERAGDDLDEQLLRVRESLEPRFGEGFSFFDKDVRSLWRRSWDQFVEWAAKIHASGRYSAEEIDYKHKIAENVREVRRAILADEPEWISALKRAVGPPNNLTSWRSHANFIRWCTKHEADARAGLRELWTSSDDPLVALERFGRRLPDAFVAGMGTRARMLTFLLLAIDPAEFPVYLDALYSKLYKLVPYPPPEMKASELGLYRHALALLDEFRRRARERDLDLRDRMDAAAVAYVIATGEPLDEWSEQEKKAFRDYVGQPIVEPPEAASQFPSEPEDDPLARLADELLVSRESLAEIAELLADKGQIIFHGPPGTGKTYIARKLAAHLCGSQGRVELVQFHPSYAYEDFVEGFRPSAEGGSAFALTPGPLKRLARRAEEDPDNTYVLVIDEINRGNVARVFGELYFLLDYRGERIKLQYSPGESFRLPKNLWIIATMNTADRSIGLLDAALRRRFYFVGFFPDTDPIKGLLRRWLERNHPDLLWVADRVDRANDQLKDRDAAIGPSYFMSTNTELDARWVEIIWAHSVLPYIEERLFGERDRVASFKLDALGRAAAAVSSEAETAVTQ